MLRRKGLSRASQLRRVAIIKKYVYTGLSVATLNICLRRAAGVCEACGKPLGPRRGIDWSAHHRLARRMGGSSNPAINTASNIVILCGSGVTGCHGAAEANRTDAYARGLLLHSGEVPSATSVDLVYGLVFLDDVGGWELVPS